MLAPDDRRTLLEALRPPLGYQLDRAIGTTYSLDLQALLLAPLAFTLFGWQDEAGKPGADPLALLEAVRSHASRIRIFCQAGQIAIPRPNQLLLSYLEPSVHEVRAPDRRGVFHPKVWALRFAPQENGRPISYRVLCLSRNLTFDRSWDTALVLDGEVTERSYGYGDNRPLADFIAALPDLATHSVPAQVVQDVEVVQSELRKVSFALPEDFEKVTFHPLGHRGRHPWPFAEAADRRLVISPFLAAGVLEKLSTTGRDHVLVSRLEALEAVEPAVLARFRSIYTLDQAAEIEPDEEEELEAALPETLTGLHAKLYIEEVAQQAHVWTGSANTTEAGFGHNVEFLARLIGPKAKCGVAAFLEIGRRGTSFRQLLRDFRPAEQAMPPDAVQERLEKRLQAARQTLVDADLSALATTTDDGTTFLVGLRRGRNGGVTWPAHVNVRCWPISLPAMGAVALQLDHDPVTILGPLSLEALTSFLAFELTTAEGNRTAAARFVLAVPLAGVPADRGARLLRALLRDRDQVLRFLYLLLAEGNSDPEGVLEALHSQATHRTHSGVGGLPLLEVMLRALDRNPEKLDSVARFVADLRTTPEGRELLPAGFDTIWEPIAAVRESKWQP
jgi:hypothetical protein